MRPIIAVFVKAGLLVFGLRLLGKYLKARKNTMGRH
jgi:hypothetical protein